MKRILLYIIGFLTMTPIYAYDFMSEGIAFQITSEDKHEVAIVSASYGGYSGSIVIPAYVSNGSETYTVTTVGGNAFAGCNGMESVELPNTIETIENNSFWQCRGLTAITIPNSVNSIANNAFRYCENLQELTLGSSLRTVEKYAFADCSNLTSIKSLSEVPPSMHKDVFVFATGIFNNAKVYVPKGSKLAYSAAEVWKSFRTIVEDGEENGPQGESYNEFLESNWWSYSILSTGKVWTLQIQAYIKNNGSEDITLKKLVIVEPSNQSVLKTITDESVLGLLKAGEKKTVYYIFATNVGWDTHWYEWTYEYKGHEFLFCSSPNDPMDVSPVMSDTNRKEIGILNLDGKRISKLGKGVNIIKYSDGTTKKVINK